MAPAHPLAVTDLTAQNCQTQQLRISHLDTGQVFLYTIKVDETLTRKTAKTPIFSSYVPMASYSHVQYFHKQNLCRVPVPLGQVEL